MSTPVNYYHYSVYKLLGVNLRTLLNDLERAENFFRLRPGCKPADCRLRRREAGERSGRSSASVDKPMYIHRIECAKPPDLPTAVFLSSFGPRQTQALFSSFKL